MPVSVYIQRKGKTMIRRKFTDYNSENKILSNMNPVKNRMNSGATIWSNTIQGDRFIGKLDAHDKQFLLYM